MQFAVMVWVNSGDSAKMGTVFGVWISLTPAHCRYFRHRVIGLNIDT